MYMGQLLETILEYALNISFFSFNPCQITINLCLPKIAQD